MLKSDICNNIPVLNMIFADKYSVSIITRYLCTLTNDDSVLTVQSCINHIRCKHTNDCTDRQCKCMYTNELTAILTLR